MTVALPTSLHVDHLLPALCPSADLNGVKLCDDGFSDSPASIQLSRTLSMAIQHGAGTTVKRVSQRALDDMGLTVRQAWDAAALNLQRRALTDRGLRFFTRPAEHSLPGAHSGWKCAPNTVQCLPGSLIHKRSLLWTITFGG